MSKTSRWTGRERIATMSALAAAVAVLVVGGLLLRHYAPGNMGTGFMVGGLVALLGFAVAVWRSSTRPEAASTFERAFTQLGDERDDTVLTSALAVLGLAAVPLTGVAAITLALGGEVSMVMALLLLSEIAVGAVAFVVINRRR